jgi:hypothetical protein
MEKDVGIVTPRGLVSHVANSWQKQANPIEKPQVYGGVGRSTDAELIETRHFW